MKRKLLMLALAVITVLPIVASETFFRGSVLHR